jgi:RNA polymerase sigma-54 factor
MKVFILVFRKSNLQKVTECLFQYQIEYFKKGPEFLKPKTLTELAVTVGMSEGTLSRLVNAKYILTPWGIKPLRYFFSIPVKQEFGDISPTMIKEHIKNCININAEPASDSKIASILEKKEIKISRRTVAKYRKQINIFNSYERKACCV